MAGLAATLLIGLAIARYAASTASDLQVLNAVGMTPRQSRRAALLGPALAAAGGVTVGAAATMVASRWFPIGSASVVEPNPGLDIDLVVLSVGVLGTPLLVAVTAAGTAGLALRTTRSARVCPCPPSLAPASHSNPEGHGGPFRYARYCSGWWSALRASWRP
jgi:hypothetical protein